MHQFALNFSALARRKDRDTAKEAAARTDGPSLAARVLEELRAHGPGTSHELAERLGLSLVTVSPRMAPLERAGHIEAAGTVNRRTLWKAKAP